MTTLTYTGSDAAVVILGAAYLITAQLLAPADSHHRPSLTRRILRGLRRALRLRRTEVTR